MGQSLRKSSNRQIKDADAEDQRNNGNRTKVIVYTWQYEIGNIEWTQVVELGVREMWMDDDNTNGSIAMPAFSIAVRTHSHTRHAPLRTISFSKLISNVNSGSSSWIALHRAICTILKL